MSERTRLCLACPHLSTGGMPRYVLNLVKGLRQHPFDVYLVENMDYGYDKVKSLLRPLVVAHERTEDLSGFCKKHDIQIVHAHDWLWQRPDLPTLFTPHVYDVKHLANIRNQDVDMFVLINSAQAKLLHGRPYKYIPSFVDTDEFRAERFAGRRKEILAKYGLPDAPVVINVGLVSANKNQDTLVRNWHDVNASLVIVGPLADNTRETWEPLVAMKKEDVFFLGEQDNVAELLSVADMAALPSFEDCASLAMLEAAAMGVPLVLSDTVSSASYFHTDGEKLVEMLPPTGDVVGRIRALLGTQQAKDMALRAMQHVRRYHGLARGAELHAKAYAAAMPTPRTGHQRFLLKPSVKVKAGFFYGPRLEIEGPPGTRYQAQFVDADNNAVLHRAAARDKMGEGITLSAPQRYYVNWKVDIQSDTVGRSVYSMSLKGKKVGIVFSSSALGDTLAWFPYLEEFAVAHECTLVVTTKWAELLRPVFQDKPWISLHAESRAPNTDIGYSLGVYDNDPAAHRNTWRVQPLQQVGADILGVPYVEKHLDLRCLAGPKPDLGPYVCIAHASTMRAKEWTTPGGWKAVVEFLLSRRITPVDVSLEHPLDLPGVVRPDLKDLRAGALTYIHHSGFFIGLPGGLSWLAAALRKKVFMIAGFSMPHTEFAQNVTRIQNFSVCHGCYTDSSLPFTRAFEWCPRNNGYICTAAIRPGMVTAKLKEWLDG